MLTRKMILAITTAVLAVTSAANAGTTYFVDPCGSDNADGLSWATAFATIQKGITAANDGTPTSYAVVDVNSGTYETGPIILDNNSIEINFRPDVNVAAYSIFDANDPNDPDDPNSFRYLEACLFKAVEKSNIVFDGNDTLLEMNKDEYPPSAAFWPSTDVDVDADTIDITIEYKVFPRFRTGDIVCYTRPKDAQSVGGLNNWWRYYVITIAGDDDTIKLASSYANATADPPISINLTEATDSGMHWLWGGDPATLLTSPVAVM
jgi:hypothetical protein